ncbi:hypothetical protein PILCRDRAFT_822644 [Piloderma croceum F 1598]|uniref:Uncharacterized protein n=1 Tax=Piloderma croceum (strain F 1598) TaxID=765440 RepID=A0A0C3F6A4_PILCF|nr:hypothetical protein PILCRDRAFT_822644 [Piloderma croceum F 1598]
MAAPCASKPSCNPVPYSPCTTYAIKNLSTLIQRPIPRPILRLHDTQRAPPFSSQRTLRDSSDLLPRSPV